MSEERRIDYIKHIQSQKKKDMEESEMPVLNPEGIRLAEEKRFTFDVINTPVDPLR